MSVGQAFLPSPLSRPLGSARWEGWQAPPQVVLRGPAPLSVALYAQKSRGPPSWTLLPPLLAPPLSVCFGAGRLLVHKVTPTPTGMGKLHKGGSLHRLCKLYLLREGKIPLSALQLGFPVSGPQLSILSHLAAPHAPTPLENRHPQPFPAPSPGGGEACPRISRSYQNAHRAPWSLPVFYQIPERCLLPRARKHCLPIITF